MALLFFIFSITNNMPTLMFFYAFQLTMMCAMVSVVLLQCLGGKRKKLRRKKMGSKTKRQQQQPTTMRKMKTRDTEWRRAPHLLESASTAERPSLMGQYHQQQRDFKHAGIKQTPLPPPQQQKAPQMSRAAARVPSSMLSRQGATAAVVPPTDLKQPVDPKAQRRASAAVAEKPIHNGKQQQASTLLLKPMPSSLQSKAQHAPPKGITVPNAVSRRGEAAAPAPAAHFKIPVDKTRRRAANDPIYQTLNELMKAQVNQMMEEERQRRRNSKKKKEEEEENSGEFENTLYL